MNKLFNALVVFFAVTSAVGVGRLAATQIQVVTLPELLERSPLVISGTVKSIGEHTDPVLNTTYDTVTLSIDKVLKYVPGDNRFVDKQIVAGGTVKVMFGIGLRKRYTTGTKGIWIARYYNNTFWLDDSEVYRPLDKVGEIAELIRIQGQAPKSKQP